MSVKSERKIEIIRDLGARFLEAESNPSSLLTVTRAELSRNGKYATIFFTVFPKSAGSGSGDQSVPDWFSPEQMEKTALEFAKRKRSEFKRFVMDNSRLGIIPMLDFEIDLGEKNRQKIDELLNENKA